ncbi:unnamed protein product [Caenorhabditis sp. 36 PRJEB53466]|nr:unnamed protein product [Caenorhabditis sp. 36 PRJEB53466]
MNILLFFILFTATADAIEIPTTATIPTISIGILCSTCESFIGTVQEKFQDYAPSEETGEMLIGLCSSFFGFVAFMENQCRTCVTKDLETLKSALSANESANAICAKYLKLC